ncbi:MAG: DUF2512 family protein [Bacillota bacterium]|nr:DUF2512 family protein [Bacillota bacterium]
MKHIYSLVIKYVMTAIILELILGSLTALTFGDILLISLVVTIIAYLIGDLLILPATNNTVATLSDAVLAFITIFAFNYYYGYTIISYGDAIIAAVVLGVGEWLFHKYVAKVVFPDRDEGRKA